MRVDSARRAFAAAVALACALACGGARPAHGQEQRPIGLGEGGPEAASPAQAAAPAQVTRERVEARLVERPEGFALQIEGEPALRELAVDPELVRRLGLDPGARYRVLALERRTPGGALAAVRFEDRRGMVAIVESIHDVPLLQPAEREGLRVEQVSRGPRTFVSEDECRLVYNVPTRFVAPGLEVVLVPGESKDVRLGDADYELTLGESRFVVDKGCPYPLEGPRVRIDYTLRRR